MPRPQKEGIDYFPLDVNFFIDKKIKILKARFGADGITIYLYLLCEIYRAGYYLHFDDDALFITSDDLNMSPDKVKQVLKFLLERSLFDNILFQSDTILTSAGIQRRFQLAVKERAKKNPVEIKDFWLLTAVETEPFIKVNPDINNSRKNDSYSGKNQDKSREVSLKESKVKESKEYKEVVAPPAEPATFSPESFEMQCADRLIGSVLEQLPGAKVPVNDRERQKWAAEIEKMQRIDKRSREQISQTLDYAIKSTFWRTNIRSTAKLREKFETLYLQSKERTSGSGKSNPKNQFHNFDQRDTDYDALMLKQVQTWVKEEADGRQT